MLNPNRIDLTKTAIEHIDALEQGSYSASDLAKACLLQSEKKKHLNAFLHINPEHIMEQAAESDQRRSQNALKSKLDGIPVSIKDNICIKDSPLGCASKILKGYHSPYDATVIEKLKNAGAILFGRTNMDEFAMGSSTENSAYGLTYNPWNQEHVPGGSSGGAAVSIAAGITPLALGSDTGGSIRQPASFCGVTGIKPTYGRVSRYGLAAYASSLDQIGALAKTPQDCALLLSIIEGFDDKDSSSLDCANAINPRIANIATQDWKNMTIGVYKSSRGNAAFNPEIIESQNIAIDHFRKLGAKTIDIQSKYEEYMIPTYYILATAEASSNLSRYDGIRYGHRAKDHKDLLELYIKSRTECFGEEVKRRILLGTFVLSSGYYDAYYKTAQKLRILIQNEYKEFFKKCDVILKPASIDTAFRLNDKIKDPIAMYQSDLLTISVNLAGLPAISVPAGISKNNLPIGLQLLAAHFDENKLLNITKELTSIKTFQLDYNTTIISDDIKITKIIAKNKPIDNTSSNHSAKTTKKQQESEMKKKASKKKATKKVSKKKTTKKVSKKKAAKKVSKKKVAKKKKASKKKAAKKS